MIQDLIKKFCLVQDLSTYDPFDVWKTSFGQAVRKKFYNNKYLGYIPAAILTLFDFFINNHKRCYYKKQEYPIVRALAALSLIRILKASNKKEYLHYLRQHLDWLADNYIKGYSGYCWGLSIEWISRNVYYNKTTPHVTHTPYVLEAFVEYLKIDKNPRYEAIAKSIFYFLEKDIPVLLDKNNMLALSYSPLKEPRIIINANTYILYMYSLLLSFFYREKYHIEDKIQRLYNFIANYQNPNGSWFYYAGNEKANFVDCFHSCFNLKNLFKAKNIVALKGVDDILTRGFKYVEKNFLDTKTGLFRRYSVYDKTSFIRFDLYDNAEVLNLLTILGEMDKAQHLLEKIKKYFLEKNDIYSSIDVFNSKRNKNMLRWSLPFIHAYSNYWSRACVEY